MSELGGKADRRVRNRRRNERRKHAAIAVAPPPIHEQRSGRQLTARQGDRREVVLRGPASTLRRLVLYCLCHHALSGHDDDGRCTAKLGKKKACACLSLRPQVHLVPKRIWKRVKKAGRRAR